VTAPQVSIHGVVDALIELATKLGVSFVTGQNVSGLSKNAGRVVEVKTPAGSHFPQALISTVDVIRTHRLLGLRHGSESAPPSLSGLVVLLGVEGVRNELVQHNIFFPKNYRAEFEAISDGNFPEDPTLYVHLGCRTNPQDAPRGHENWFVMANAPPLGPSELAAPDQEALFGDRIISMLVDKGVLNREQIKVRKILGPAHLKAFGHRGSIYGRAPHSLLSTLRPSPRVKGLHNLFLAGGTVHPGGGMPLAMLSGKHAAEQMLKQL
jgi:phytoene desaturase